MVLTALIGGLIAWWSGLTPAGIALPLLLALIKAVVAIGGILALGHWLIRPVFHQVAAAHSTELFTLTALLVSLTAAWLTFELGLSLALGAFLAGMLLSETEFNHQIEIDIRPFRDILMGVFFISVGAQLDLFALPEIWASVLLLTVALILGKGLIVGSITRLMGYESGVALRTGMVLANGGEFGFALLTLALANRLLTPAETQPVLLAIVFSMLLAPLLVKYNGTLAKKLFARTYLRGIHLQVQQVEAAAHEVHHPVLFCGFGRIGQNLAAFLRPEGIDYLALDLDPQLVKDAWEAGERVFYGDSTHAEVLRAADVAHARMVLVTFDDAATCEKIIHLVRKLSPAVPILVRTRDGTYMERLEAAGATRVIPETLEASMMLSRIMLQALRVDDAEIDRLVEAARADHYHTLRGVFHGDEAETLAQAERPRLHTVTLAPSDHAVGRCLGELKFGQAGIVVNAICRAGVRGEKPEPETRLLAGDAVIIEGGTEALAHAEAVLRSG
ncbi:MAG: cation:proton antiporter [Thiotrichales bacterium]